MPFVCEYFFVLSGPPVSAVSPCVVPGRTHRARGCPCMFGRVVLTQAGISPKQPGFSRDIWDGNCGTPSLAPAPFPSVAGRDQQGPAQHGGGFALLPVCPPTLFSCSGITNSPSPKSFWTLCFMVWGLRSNPIILGAAGAAAPRCPGSGQGLDVGCPGPGEGGQGWDFCPPLSLGLVELQLPGVPAMEKVAKGWKLVAPAPEVVAKGWKLPPCPRHVWMSHSQVPSSL